MRTNTNKQYWHDEMDDWITEYNRETDTDKKNEIYTEILHQPFKRLIESMLRLQSLYDDENLQDCITHIYKGLKNYKKEEGKSFSYFSYVIKNWMMQKKIYKIKHDTISLDTAIYDDEEHTILDTIQYEEPENIFYDIAEERNKRLYKIIMDIFRNEEKRLMIFNKVGHDTRLKIQKLIKLITKKDGKHIIHKSNTTNKLSAVLPYALKEYKRVYGEEYII